MLYSCVSPLRHMVIDMYVVFYMCLPSCMLMHVRMWVSVYSRMWKSLWLIVRPSFLIDALIFLFARLSIWHSIATRKTEEFGLVVCVWVHHNVAQSDSQQLLRLNLSPACRQSCSSLRRRERKLT